MDFEIQILQDSLPCEKISELYEKTYVEKYFERGANDWKNPKYTEFYFNAYHHDRRFFYSAWKEDQLIATMFGTPNTLKIDDEVEVSAISLGLAATLPEFQRQGVQKALIQRLIDDAKDARIDLVYAFPEKGLGGNELLKNYFNFKRYMKNQQHYIKVMGDYGRKILQDYRGLNVVLAKLLKLYAGIPGNQVERGEIRDGKESDIGEVVDILNSYQKRVQISQVWTEEHLRAEMEGAKRLDDLLGPPCGNYWKVWDDGKVLASFFIRMEMIHFKNGSAPIALLSETIFHEEVTEPEKLGVIATLVRWVRDEHPQVFTTQSTQPQYELKAYKDLNFIDDTSTYEFLVLPLSEEGVGAIKRHESYKDIFMPYHR
jgi:GNAT superfamily N-acetyltransferase